MDNSTLATTISSAYDDVTVEPMTSRGLLNGDGDVMSEIIRRIEMTSSVNASIDFILVLVVIQTMLGLGCTLDVELIKNHLLQPTGIAIASCCQFGIMPLVAFLCAKLFKLDQASSIAVMITGTCPGGNLSNIFTFFVYGDMNLSILMSTTSTLLALVMMPLCLLIYGSNWMTYSEMTAFIPFGGICLTLFLTLFPVAIGIVIRRHNEKIANHLMKIALLGALTAFVALMTLACIVFGSLIFRAISPACYVIAIFMPLFGYGLGYAAASAFQLPDASRRTVAIETGCQNSQLAATILKMAFASHHMGAYFLFPVYYGIFQSLEGLGLIILFRVYRKLYYDQTHIVAQSRVTYEKFDDDIDVEHRSGVGSYYQQQSRDGDAMEDDETEQINKKQLTYSSGQ